MNLNWKNLEVGWDVTNVENPEHWVMNKETGEVIITGFKTLGETLTWVDGVRWAQGGYEEEIDLVV